MKNYLLATIITIATFGSAGAIDISKCTKYGEPGPRGDWIVQCDTTDELREMQSGDADCKFLSTEPTLFTTVKFLSDPDHIYINIVPNECGPNTTGYRIFKQDIKEIREDTLYAVGICE